jgi:PKHD-type hydroxylase
MDYQILSLLEPSELDHVLAELARQSFVDGQLTAQGGARNVKSNLQLPGTDSAATELGRVVLSALRRNETFQAFALPRRVMPPLFNRYEPGMQYGAHVDGAIMATAADPMRTDLAMTLFLSPPDSYEGGELILEQSSGEEEVKLASGEALVYSAKCIHRVRSVRSGVRLAAVSWVQSAVRDERVRAILYDLHRALRKLQDREEEALLVSKSYHNLLRLAAEL